MDHASLTIALWFIGSVMLFAAFTGFLVYDQHLAGRRALARAQEPLGFPPPGRSISRTRLAIVAVTFCVWSLLVAEHLRPRR